MPDALSPSQRSACMASIKSRDTAPEMCVRRMVHGLGFRFRLHRADLPGTPDLVLPRLRKVIFVHGCFWHLHSCRKGRTAPQTRVEFWRAKRESNSARDKTVIASLRRSGWRVLVVWECQTHVKANSQLQSRLLKFLR